MKSKVLLLIPVLLLCCSIFSIAQKELSDAETQYFFGLVRQTKEFKSIKARTDSINNSNKNNVPQELDLNILKKETDGSTDENIFTALLDRTVLGMAIEQYYIKYDKRKKQIISIQKKETQMRMN